MSAASPFPQPQVPCHKPQSDTHPFYTPIPILLGFTLIDKNRFSRGGECGPNTKRPQPDPTQSVLHTERVFGGQHLIDYKHVAPPPPLPGPVWSLL